LYELQILLNFQLQIVHHNGIHHSHSTSFHASPKGHFMSTLALTPRQPVPALHIPLVSEKIKAAHLKIGYGLSLASAREWGLYISASRGKTSIGIEEPALFSEPGVFIVRPDGTLYYGATQTMPFARPQFQDLLGAIDFAIAKDYPARGEYTGSV
jgi:hypothetical protein